MDSLPVKVDYCLFCLWCASFPVGKRRTFFVKCMFTGIDKCAKDQNRLR